MKRKILAMSNCRTFPQRIPPLASSFIPSQQTLTAMTTPWRHSWLKWRQDLARQTFINFCGRPSLQSGAANVARGLGSSVKGVT